MNSLTEGGFYCTLQTSVNFFLKKTWGKILAEELGSEMFFFDFLATWQKADIQKSWNLNDIK